MLKLHFKMIFKFGMTVIVFVAIVIYLIGQRDIKNEADENHNDDSLSLENNDVNKVESFKDKEKEKRLEKKDFDNNSIHTASEVNVIKNGKAEMRLESSKYISNAIHLSVVACGDRSPEIMVLLKSAVLFTSTPLVFHIFAEKKLQQSFKEDLEFWPQKYRSQISYFVYDLQFPTGKDSDKWKKLFKPCASQRLFLPQLLKDVDSLIYLDSDVLFTSPIDQLYHHFTLFNSTQLAALVPESEDKATGWYNRFARHPYYGVLGVNSGVMLMNLTRLRQSTWKSSVLEYFKEYELKLTWGDQDLINIYFYYFPHQLFILTCDWNFRPDHCMYMSVCKKAESDGVKVVHGSRRVYFNEKQPAFRAVYDAIKDHPFTASVQYALTTKINRLLKNTEHTNCGKLATKENIFTKHFISV